MARNFCLAKITESDSSGSNFVPPSQALEMKTFECSWEQFQGSRAEIIWLFSKCQKISFQMKVISVERGKGEEVAKNLNFHPDTPKKSFSSYSFVFSFHCNQFKSSSGSNDRAATSVATEALATVVTA